MAVKSVGHQLSHASSYCMYGNERSTKKVYCIELRCTIGVGANNLKAVDISCVHVYQCGYNDKKVIVIIQALPQ